MAFTPDQQKQIKTILANYRKKAHTILTEHREKVMQIVGKYDQSNIDRIHDKIKRV